MLERSLPLPTLQHLSRLTDDCGVIQHAKFWLPDYAQGYCIDDNSRALIVAHRYYQLFGDEVAHELMVRYLAFVFYMQRPDGRVRNFLSYARTFLEETGSPDSLGRTIWALGHLSIARETYLAVPAQEMFRRALAHSAPNDPPHTLAYTILGLCAYGEDPASRENTRELVRPIAAALLRQYWENRADDWEWFLPAMTYANGRLPEALLRAGSLLDEAASIDAGLRALAFLNRVFFRGGYLSVAGCQGWYPRGGPIALFDQQPIDAGATVEANLAAYVITCDETYFDHALRAMEWFYGKNILQVPVYNERSGGCHDGIHYLGANANQGAESTLTYLMAQLRLYQQAPQLFSEETAEMAGVTLKDEG